MTHLLKLELKKNKIGKSIFVSMGLILFCIVFITISLVDSATDPTQTKDTFENVFNMIGILLSFIFIVFYSTLVSSIILKEYNSKTILIMFTYPIDKRRLICSKLSLITIFVTISLMIGYIICCSYIIGMDYFLNLLEGQFEFSMLRWWLFSIISAIIVCICIGLLTFCAGMIKKSVTVTIISSIVFIFLRQIALSSTSGYYTESILQIFVVMIITAICLCYTLSHKISKLD